MRMDDLSSWLRLREPADSNARSAEVMQTIVQALGAAAEVRVLDLATGTGANLRYLVPRLPPRQRWLVVDHDPALLARLPVLTSEWGAARGLRVTADAAGCTIRGGDLECCVETRRVDLDRLEDAGLFADRHLVTASALLDLVSNRWLEALAARCRAVRAAVLFALTYNGWSACSPPEPGDDAVRELLNRHQLRDKGLGGPAAGPAAARAAVRAFTAEGYQVRSERSPWRLGSDDCELQRMLIDGWAQAATEQSSGDAPSIADWRRRRHGHLAAGTSEVAVGHDDLAAWLPRIPQEPGASGGPGD
jgi:hypothetical protein